MPGPNDKRDEDRVASMADEGGSAGAHMDTREQLEAAPRGRLKKRRRIPWMWGAAAASAAVGGVALARTVVARRLLGKSNGSGSELEIEVERGPGRGKARRGAKGAKGASQTTGSQRTRRGARASSATKGGKSSRTMQVAQPRAERVTGSPKRRRSGNTANVRKKTNRGRQSAATR